jgi:hypothetical protein
VSGASTAGFDAYENDDRLETTPRREIPASRPAPVAASDGHARALDMWFSGVPISGTLAERYLVETRNLVLPADITPDVLRFHHACWFDGQPRPCLLALFRNIHTNEPQAIMRTALTPDAKKIKRMALGPIGGGAIKIIDTYDRRGAGDDLGRNDVGLRTRMGAIGPVAPGGPCGPTVFQT